MKILLTFFYSLFSLMLSAQVIVYDGNSFTVDKIEEDIVEELIKTVKKAIVDYDSWATLMDEQQKEVTAESLQKFKNLFERNAEVVDDLSKEADRMNYADYAGKVFEFLQEDGVRYNIYGAMIDQISYDSAGYYEVDVLSEKYVYNGLERNNKPFYCRNGRIFRIKFTFLIPENDLTIAKILRIKGKLARDCEDRVPVLSIGGQVGVSSFKPSTNRFFNNNLSNVEWTTISKIQAGLDFGVQYPIDKKDFVFFTFGVNYRFNRLESRFSGSYSNRSENEEEVAFDRFVQFVSLKENIRANVLQIPLGLRFNIVNKDPLYIFLDGGVGVNIPFKSSGTFAASIIYSGVYDDGTTEIFTLENGIITPEKLSYSIEPDMKVNYFAEFGPTLQYILGRDFAFQVGFKYQLGLSSWFNHTEESFFIAEEVSSFRKGSLLEIYTDKTKVNTFGLQIGIIYKKRW